MLINREVIESDNIKVMVVSVRCVVDSRRVKPTDGEHEITNSILSMLFNLPGILEAQTIHDFNYL